MGRTGESYASARARLWTRRDHAGPPPDLPDADLVARCAAAVQRRMRAGDPAPPAQALQRLTRGEQVLWAFWVLHAHTGAGLSGLCRELPHRAVHDDYWTLVEAGLRQLGAADLLALVGRLRAEVARALAASGWPEGLGADGELDGEGLDRLLAALGALDPGVMAELDAEYRRLEPDSLRRAAAWIRAHAGELAAPEAAP
jgi:hypothetical protein